MQRLQSFKLARREAADSLIAVLGCKNLLIPPKDLWSMSDRKMVKKSSRIAVFLYRNGCLIALENLDDSIF